MSTICLDFDGVLHDNHNVPEGKRMGPPIDGAKDAVRELYCAGHHLVVLTARQEFNHIWDWLEYFDMNHWIMGVTNVKPSAHLYIDDRGLRFESWPQTLNVIAFDEGMLL